MLLNLGQGHRIQDAVRWHAVLASADYQQHHDGRPKKDARFADDEQPSGR
jgi:hypothetical protein